jgi:hypothetical protein
LAPRVAFSSTNREDAMSDDKTKVGQADRSRINLSEDYEVRDWAERFGVTQDELRAAAEEAGPMALDVARVLNRGRAQPDTYQKPLG